MNRSAVLFSAVEKWFGPVRAVDRLDLRVGAGEVLALLGHNGAGKTTSIRMILGLVAPTRGALEVLGRSPRAGDTRDLRLRIGYLPESVSFYRQLTGREVLRYFARLKRVSFARCDELLEQMGLGQAAGRRVQTYSKGMRQRLGLAQALLRPPELLLLDEPTVGLDPLAARDFFRTLDGLRQRGTTVILCSHVLAGIESHIDRVAIMAQGRIRALGALDELRRVTGLPYVIRARGRWNRRDLERCLREQGARSVHFDAAGLEVQTDRDTKLGLMRVLLGGADLDDVEVHAPSLEELYAHFNLPDRPREALCARP